MIQSLQTFAPLLSQHVQNYQGFQHGRVHCCVGFESLHLHLYISFLLLGIWACWLTVASVRGLGSTLLHNVLLAATTVQTCFHSGWSARSFCSKYLQERRGQYAAFSTQARSDLVYILYAVYVCSICDPTDVSCGKYLATRQMSRLRAGSFSSSWLSCGIIQSGHIHTDIVNCDISKVQWPDGNKQIVYL